MEKELSREDQLLVALKEAKKVAKQQIENIPSGLNYVEYEKYCVDALSVVNDLSMQYRMIKTPTFTRELERDDDLYDLGEFVECCKTGGFIDYDGYGYYANETHMSDVTIYPSDVTTGKFRTDFTHVVWFNR